MTRTLWIVCALVLTVVLTAGCGKKAEEEVVEDPDYEIQQMEAQAERMEAEAEAQAKEIAAAAEQTVSGLQARVDKVVADVGKLVEAEDYEAALKMLQQGLAIEGLTDAQKKTLQDLLDQVKKAMASGATEDAKKKLGNLLNK